VQMPHAVPLLTIERDRLGTLGARLGKGGQATVYELPTLRLPDVEGPLVYKEYRATHDSPDSLRRIVSARLSLEVAKRARLDAIAAWPARVVEDKGVTCGVVLPRIPESYFDSLVLPGSNGTKDVPREVQNLFIDPALAGRLGRPAPSTEQRLAVCRDFAAALTFFHDELAVVFGDINAKNEVYRLGPAPMVMYLDCDGVRPAGVLAVSTQLNAPDWDPPEGRDLSRATDLYKLGLFILRCLSPGASTRRDPAWATSTLDTAGQDLLARAVKGPSQDRPDARQWLVLLSRLLGEPIEPPRLGEVVAERPFVLKGQAVLVSWTAEDAVAVDITAGGHTVRVAGATGRGSVPVRLDEAGFIEVRAVNDIGVDCRVVGPIAVVVPPVLRSLPVPMPRLDGPPAHLLAPPDLGLLPLPTLDLPAIVDPVGWFTDADRTPARTSLPELRTARCPLDIASLMIDGPELDLGLTPDPEGTR